MPDTVSKIRSDLEKRLRELEPLVQEHAHVREALDALKGVGARAERAATSTAKRVRTTAATATAKRPGRGTGNRAQEGLKLVHATPGITIGELAKRKVITANYLSRVLPQLQKDGKVEKRDKGYH